MKQGDRVFAQKSDWRIEYAQLFEDVKQRIRAAQVRASLAANREMLSLYWDVGRLIDRRQRVEGWGAAVIPRLARDIQNELPGVKGFSERNIDRIIAFYGAFGIGVGLLWMIRVGALPGRGCRAGRLRVSE